MVAGTRLDGNPCSRQLTCDFGAMQTYAFLSTLCPIDAVEDSVIYTV